MKCPSCGVENTEPLDGFCQDCGAQLASAEESQDSTVVLREPPASEGTVLREKYTIRGLLAEHRWIEYRVADPSGGNYLIVDGRGDESFSMARDLLTSVDSPALWKVLDSFDEAGKSWLVGEPLGTSVADILAAGKMSEEETAVLGAALCDSLALVHGRGLIHCNVSPRTVFRRADGSWYLRGFERLNPLDKGRTDYTVNDGFSPPESYGVGGKEDVRSDLYCVGALMYYCLTGEKSSLADRESFFVFRPLSLRGVIVSRPLESVILRAVSKNICDRWESAQAMKEALIATRTEQPEPRISTGAPGFIIARKSDVGRVREVNEDSCLTMHFDAVEKSKSTSAHLLIVSDGMGGEAEGEKASSLAVRTIADHVLEQLLPVVADNRTRLLLPDDPRERGAVILRDAILKGNGHVFEYSLGDPCRRGMGATVTAALIEGDLVTIGHVGDTRCYIIKDDLRQLTEDHSFVGKLVSMGHLTREEALTSPQRNQLYRALGTSDHLDVDIYHHTLSEGEYMVLTSDGVWEYFTDAEMISLVKNLKEPQTIVDRLIEICLERGADDNCTVIVMHVGAR
jgi:protein phosphatase